jgi:hypothetical protein
VHRGFRRDDFLRGAREVRRRGMEIRTGVILGLPRDTMEGFLGTVEFVKDNGLGDGVEIYPLSVLPGTNVRARAAELDLRYMPDPPYWVLGNGAMREPDFVEALEIAEAAFDIDFFQPVLPRFENPWPGLVSYRDLRAPGEAARFLAEIRSSPAILATSLSLLLGGPGPREPRELEAIGRVVRAASPHTSVRLVVEHDRMPPYAPWARVADAFHVPGSYLDRIHYYATDAQGRFSVRLLHLTGDPVVAERYFANADAPPFDVLLRYSRRLLEPGSVLDRMVPLLVPDELSTVERAALAERYRGAEGLIVYDRT